jgi:hypothetical protein
MSVIFSVLAGNIDQAYEVWQFIFARVQATAINLVLHIGEAFEFSFSEVYLIY